MEALQGRGPIEQIVDFRLRSGPYGDGFGDNAEGLTLAVLEENPHGVDLGPLQPRIPNVLRTASGKIELAPDEIVADVPRLRSALAKPTEEMVLIGRRQLRSNNSWMHNIPTMMRGSNRCTLLVHPDDASRIGLVTGAAARIRSRVGEIEAAIEVTDEVMPGVVSLPHGWGHAQAGVKLKVAGAYPGVSSNDLADEQIIDPLSGNAVLNAIPVSIEPANVSDEEATAAELV
jgi:anaerobic selenocysteine-containing dehydrogenase